MPSTRTVVLGALVVLALAVGLASVVQRTAARTGSAHYETGRSMLEAMLDQETGVRGFALSQREVFLDPYRGGVRQYESDLRQARAQVAGDEEASAELAASDAAARRWMAMADTAIAGIRAGNVRRTFRLEPMLARKAAMDAYRATNRRYSMLLLARADQLETLAAALSVGLIVVLGGILALAGLFLGRRAAAARRALRGAEHAFDACQRELNFGLQVTESEEEAQGILHRHLEQTIPGSEVVVLKRNNSANRLSPGTPVAAGSKLEGAFEDAEPRSCLAIRLAQRRSHTPGKSYSVLECGICGRLDVEITCSPLLVGGEVIGSVLVGHPDPLADSSERALDESIKQAAPVLANLRNLAIAETRAATDGLTGLPNRRAFEESLKRMAAHAGRSRMPLAAVALDLDHFKRINDVHGHGTGDEVLAQVGALLSSMVRESDFVARVGGEEFTLLMPDTDRQGALVICERIRAAIGALEFSTVALSVTASLGVAVLPDDEVDASSLVRAADRMLYRAKERGRDRVEISDSALGPTLDAVPAQAG